MQFLNPTVLLMNILVKMTVSCSPALKYCKNMMFDVNIFYILKMIKYIK